MIRLGILDDHPVVIWGMERALHGHSGIEVVATGTIAETLDVTGVDVLLLDVYLGSDIPSTNLVARLALHTRIVMMSATRNVNDIEAGIRAGASGFLDKSAPREEITATIRSVAAGRAIRPALQRADPSLADSCGLSPREAQVICMIGSGLTHEQIARRIGISRHTVDTYVKRVRAKLNIGNKAELARLADRLAWNEVA
ncbi:MULTISPECIES: LuxR C-terminal-related transcriptional regulator [unclassified Micromonospora]|uniref:LuxR C-terminal-related transcriptional regulator n=1 Tax=unclassified Micromonospora TaxID=2617518 RepID=UPI003A886D50